MGSPNVRCRQIGESDIDGVASLLTGGFSKRNRAFWLRALGQLRDRRSPAGFPKYGYLLESNGVPVGAILLIFSALGAAEASRVRCNVSSWYVEPEFRGYASMLVSQALRHKEVTYVNVSPAPNTWPIIEAQGFSRYCDGIFVAVPILNLFTGDARAKVIKAGAQADDRFDPVERDLLLQHAELGCISVWCVTQGAGLSVRVSPPHRQRHSLRAIDLLPRRAGLRAICRTARMAPRLSRPASCHRRFERADCGIGRRLPSGTDAEIFQRPGAAAAGRSRLSRNTPCWACNATIKAFWLIGAAMQRGVHR